MATAFEQEETTYIYPQEIQESKSYQEHHKFLIKDKISNFTISPNEKTLAISIFLKSRIRIMRLTSNKLYRLIRADYKKYIGTKFLVQYSDDGNFIYCPDRFGKLVIYRNYSQFKIFNTLNLNYDEILFIKQLDSQSIITGHFKGIIVTDVIWKKQIGRIQCRLNMNHQLEYDQINKIIIIQDRDRQIQFFELNGQRIINFEQVHKVRTQNIFLTSENNLVSSSLDDLKLWQIDYQNKCLKLLKVLEIDQPILIQLVNKTAFVLIQRYNLLILDENLIVRQKQHNYFKMHYSYNFDDYFRISKNYIAMLSSNDYEIYFNVLKKTA